MYQGEEVVAVEAVSAAQVFELDEDGQPGHMPSGALYQADAGGQGAPGSQEVVDDEHPAARCNGVRVDLHSGLAVLEGVARPVGVVRELSRLTQRDQRLGQLDREGGGE